MPNPNARVDPELGDLLGPLAGLTQPPASFKVPKSDDTSVSINYLINSNIRGLLGLDDMTPEQVELLRMLLSFSNVGKE